MTATTGVTKLNRTDPMLAEINRGLMVSWINADLFSRGHHDVRRSIALYDEHQMFVTAFDPDGIPGLAVQAENAAAMAALVDAGVRFWSVGIV